MIYAPLPIGKFCRRCFNWYPLDQMVRAKHCTYKRDALCKACNRRASSDWQKNNAALANERKEEWQKAHPDKRREYNQRYYKNHKAEHKKRVKAWRRQNPSRVKAIQDKWLAANKNLVSARAQGYRQQPHVRERSKIVRALYQSRPEIAERYKERGRRWRQTPKYRDWYIRYNSRADVRQRRKWRDQMRVRTYQSARKATYHRRAARKRGLPDTLRGQDWNRALMYFNHTCAVCSKPIRGLFHTVAADHWIPITSPVCPGTVATNIVPLCQGQDGCNNSKSNRDPREWLIGKYGSPKGKQILKRIEDYFEWVREQDKE
jgi:hypothetical protein